MHLGVAQAKVFAFTLCLSYSCRMEENLPTSQLDAAAVQSTKYQGEPCARGHDGVRYTTSRGCVQCTKEASEARAERVRKLLAGESPA